jgi:hypothetical protein
VNLAIRQTYQTTLNHIDDGSPADNPNSIRSESERATVFPVDIFGFHPNYSYFQVAQFVCKGILCR